MGAWCQLCTVWTIRPAREAARATAPNSSLEDTSGFSHRTWRPRASARWMNVAWLEGGVQMSTKSRGSPSRSSSGESYQRAPGRSREHSARWPGRASAAAAISTSGRSSQPGRCPWMATLPKPMIPPRRILLELVLADDGLQGFVEDREPGQSGLFADDERRVDAHGGRVRHGGQSAAQALLVESLGDVLAERLLGPAVLHELDAQEEAAAPDLAHRSEERR